MTVTHRHGADTFQIRAGGRIVTEHRLAPSGAHRTVRLPEHTDALQNVVLATVHIGSAVRDETEPATIADRTSNRRPPRSFER